MAQSLNLCTFIGNLGQDPDVRFAPDGKKIVNFSIGVGESWKDKNTGQKHERTEWPRIVVFGALADIAAEYLKKGSKVNVVAKFRQRKWQDEHGNDKYANEFVIDQFFGHLQMLDSKNDGSGNQRADQQAQSYQRNGAQSTNNATQNSQQHNDRNPPAGDYDDFSDDIPF